MLQRMAEDALLRDIPVVVMSSIPETSVAERCKGYAAFMPKPFKITEVIALTKRLTGDNSVPETK